MANENESKPLAADEILRTAIEIVEKTLAIQGVRVERVILFGSRAREESMPESDYDLYVLTDRDLDFSQRHALITRIKRELAVLRIPNDIVLRSAQSFNRVKKIPGNLAFEVAREGVPVS
ncbi:MAG: nucleotidyltransferase domain-containing protein [Actinobacteria bacterium]|nr:nucleotidyltransferase domain-containing protein [Actinomycetota bacterium]